MLLVVVVGLIKNRKKILETCLSHCRKIDLLGEGI